MCKTMPGSACQSEIMSFGKLGERYDRSRRLPSAILRDAITHATRQCRDAAGSPYALDCGCGTGQMLPALHSAGWITVGLDPAEPVLSTARRRCRTAVVAADGTRLPFLDAAFGLVIVAHVIEHVAAWRSLIEECRRVTGRDGAVVFISTPGFIRNSPRSAIKEALKKRGWHVTRAGPAGLAELDAEL